MKDLKARFPIYAQLIKLYPASYRKRYGEEILQLTADMLDEAPSATAKLRIWARLIVDTPLNIFRQQYNYALTGVTNMQTPKYVKSNGLIAGLLLMPFFLALTANGLDKVLRNQTLYHSWLWHRPTIGIWVLVLPILALLVATTGYLKFVFRDGQKEDRSILRRVLDIYHAWPLLLTGVIAFGILGLVEFHDSAQCWTKSPEHAVAHVGHTLQCTEMNSVSPTVLFRD